MNKYNILILFSLLFSVSIITPAIGGRHESESDSDGESDCNRPAKMSLVSNGQRHSTVVRHVDDLDEIPMDLIHKAMMLFCSFFFTHIEYEKDFIEALSEKGLIPEVPKGFRFGSGDSSDYDDSDDDNDSELISLDDKKIILSIDWQILVNRLARARELHVMNIFMDALEHQGRIKEKNESEVIRFLQGQGWGYICGGCPGSKGNVRDLSLCSQGMIAKPGCTQKVFSLSHAWTFVRPNSIEGLLKKHQEKALDLLNSIE